MVDKYEPWYFISMRQLLLTETIDYIIIEVALIALVFKVWQVAIITTPQRPSLPTPGHSPGHYTHLKAWLLLKLCSRYK